MYLVAISAAILSFITPFWGLFLIVGFGSKYLVPKQNRVFWVINLIGLISIGVLGKGQLSAMNILDALFGCSIVSIVYFWALNSSKSYTKAIFLAFLLGLIYSIIRNWLFSKEITKMINTSYNFYINYLEKVFSKNTDKLMQAKDILFKMKNVLTGYQIAIWNISEMFFLYLAVIVMLNKQKKFSLHKTFRMPYISVYLLIIALVITLFVHTRIVGINLTLSLTTLFLIQGFSILDYFWGKIFAHSKILMILLIISLLLNTFVLILVALTGLLDIWIDMRKLNQNYE